MITMLRGLLALEVVVLVLLLQTNQWFKFNRNSNANHIQPNDCSRERSQIVRTVLTQKFYPVLEKFKKTQSLPLDCPFHPKREILWWPDLVCYNSDVDRLVKKKTNLFFYDYLSYLNAISKWVCPICGLKLATSEQLIKHFDDNHREEFQVPDDAICLADYCDIVRCDVLTGSETSKTRQQTSSKVGVSDESNEPNCDKDKLKRLYDKCTKLIRQCTLGTLKIESSMNEFDELESDLSESMCSYLTCEQYWTNNLERPRNISILFLIVVLVLMICLFSICYYFVWCLFEADSRPTLTNTLESVYQTVNLANLGKLVCLVNVAKSRWLYKVVNKEVSDVNSQVDKNQQLFDQTRLPFKLKQSIFSVRSSSSDSIKKMQLEHLKNLELHEKRLKELERLHSEKKQKIIEENLFEEQSEEGESIERRQSNRSHESEVQGYGAMKKSHNSVFGTIVSTRSEDKDSYYGSLHDDSLSYDKESLFYEAESELRNVSTDSFKSTERKVQLKPNEQSSVCSHLMSAEQDKVKENLDLKQVKLVDQTNVDEKIEEVARRRLWNIAGDITLLNAARLKMLEQRTASRQFNVQAEESNQSNKLCKKNVVIKSKDIELKEFRSKPNPTLIPKQFEQDFTQPNPVYTSSQHRTTLLKHINQARNASPQNYHSNIDQSKRKTLYKQSTSTSREEAPKKMLQNPTLDHVMFHEQTRSQPSLSQSIRPSSTNSHL